ncbi:MAG TPA: hypothetical protein VFY04_02420 [Solirubrobacterales bacterium]|nr:hypothetical protein [Solirubrobacterales bacterium]
MQGAQSPPAPVLVGDDRDPHLQAVAQLVREKTRYEPQLLATSHRQSWRVTDLGASPGIRGFIRGLPLQATTASEAEGSAWRDLSEGLAYDRRISWLTPLDRLRRADNKLFQYQVATEANVTVPRTIVARRVSDITNYVGDPFVLKPLGAGVVHRTGETPKVFYTTPVSSSEIRDDELETTPAIAQQLLTAQRHLRVVTVGQRCWAFSLDADGLPTDWREATPRERSPWETHVPTAELAEKALDLARRFGVGFSSQDWIVQANRCWFIDLNPCGAWLFGPAESSSQVTAAIADWLMRRSQPSS